MITSILRWMHNPSIDLTDTELLNEGTFYASFIKDLHKCGYEALIESPFITSKRLRILLPELARLKTRRVKIAILTKNPLDNENKATQLDSLEAIAKLQHIGVQVIYTQGHHRKLAIIDRKILYEGSLNILSQSNSCEIMRRIESVKLSWQMIGFTGVDKYIN